MFLILRRNLSKPRIIMLAALIIIAYPVKPAHAQVDSFTLFRNAMTDYFKQQNCVPILINRGFSVGDVVEIDGINFFARSSRCFPNLKISKPEAAVLPNVVKAEAAGMSFSLKLRQLFDSSAAVDLDRKFQIRFSDVSVVSTTISDLRNALDRQACPEIVPLIDGTITPAQKDTKFFFVVSEVIYGKREAILQLSAAGNVRAKAAALGKQIADPALEMNVTDDGSVILRNNEVAPIAMKPVTVPRMVSIESFDVRSEEKWLVNWEPLNCSSGKACEDQINLFTELFKGTKPTLAREQLYQ